MDYNKELKKIAEFQYRENYHVPLVPCAPEEREFVVVIMCEVCYSFDNIEK